MKKRQRLLTTQNAKTVKGESKGFLTAILYLKPSDSSGLGNVCASASKGCIKACLNTAGRGRFNSVQSARQRRTALYYENRSAFHSHLSDEIKSLQKTAAKKNLVLCVRLNGTSDLPSLGQKLASEHKTVQFYDYTKHKKPRLRGSDNYHLTFSRSEENWSDCVIALETGINVAVVFASKVLPKTYLGYKVINGDETDLRFLDKSLKSGIGVIVGLKAKGEAKKDQTGFVVRKYMRT